MKKFGFVTFIAALAVGLAFTTNCSFNGRLGNLSGVQGSGTVKTEKRNVSGFNKIDAGGSVNIDVIVGSGFAVEVTADDNLLTNIKTETSGDTLKIFTEDSISTKNPINIKISMPEIENFEVSGASNGSIANVKADNLELKASGASKIKIEGSAKDLSADLSGASSLDGFNLKTENARVEASGASKANVSATGDLDVDASGASQINYQGEPRNIKQNSSGASSINKN